MKLLVISISIFVFTFFTSPRYAAAEEPIDRFEKAANRLVEAINEMNHDAIRRDFGEVMQDSFPLEQSKPFFENLSAQYGKIEKLDSGRFIPPDQAIFPAHFERAILDIKIVLDDRDKIMGLWFLPHTAGDAIAQEDANEASLITDSNTAADPNAVRTDIRAFEGLEEALESVSQKSQQEVREWTQRAAENRLNLAKAVQEQVVAELGFIRKLAVEEEAIKTTAAIDALLARRQERFEKITTRIEEGRKRVRFAEREERRDRDRSKRRRGHEDRRSRKQSSRRDTREQDDTDF